MVDTVTLEDLKALLGDPTKKIALDDTVTSQVRALAEELRVDRFPLNTAVAAEEFARRVQSYEAGTAELRTSAALLARWSNADNIQILENALTRLAEELPSGSGISTWISLPRYALQLLMYAAGISALSAKRYEALGPVLFSTAWREHEGTRPLIEITSNLDELRELWQSLPNLERHKTPRSDRLLEILRPQLHDLLFLGVRYERLFDQFEVLAAIAHCHTSQGDWGPFGRFTWKDHRMEQVDEVVALAKSPDGTAIARAFGGVESLAKAANAFKSRLQKTSVW